MPLVKGRATNGSGGSHPRGRLVVGSLLLLVWRDLQSELHEGPERLGSFGGDGCQGTDSDFFGDLSNRCDRKGSTMPGSRVRLSPSSPCSAGGGSGGR
jgi:hypothetical protein